MSWIFITWDDRKAYALLSLARNAGFSVPRPVVPSTYKCIVEIDCNEEEFVSLTAQMYERIDGHFHGWRDL